MSDRQASLIELFSSVQGEGPLVGMRQVFIRFSGCNFCCSYCDTEHDATEVCLLEGSPGRRDFFQVKNPVYLDHVTALLDRWKSGWPGIHHSISITGGEPLLHLEQLLEWLPVLKGYHPIYLETNGILHAELASVVDFVEYISMDIKLPSTSGHAAWSDHEKFLRIASARNVFVKAVIDRTTEDWEIIKACEIIAAADRKIALILQPVTRTDCTTGIPAVKMLELQETASGFVDEVRIIPQTHRFIGHL